MQGPSIRDRRLFFVSVEPNQTFIAAPDTYVTRPRMSAQDKKKYDVRALDGNVVHADNLFDIYLGESIAPYVTLPPLTAALPVDKPTMTLPLDLNSCQKDANGRIIRHTASEVDTSKLDSRMQKAMAIDVFALGRQQRRERQQNALSKSELHQQINQPIGMDTQPPTIAHFASLTLAYGEPTATLICDNKAVLDEMLYQVTCRTLDEAHYLLAIINSNALAKAAKPFCTTRLEKTRSVTSTNISGSYPSPSTIPTTPTTSTSPA